MTFEIIWSASAIKELKKIDRHIAKRIFDTITRLKEYPYHNIIKLTNSPYYRLRVGDYRAILDIQKNQLRILVIKVGHRKISMIQYN
ncbi:MAG: type II toxin-antitoxin system RelE/ParE family toxin [Methanosarcinales archaeon]|uniref:Type II toxin-antitoxin system RelE/ParE family toxin n=1 Tax=Candidatus Ethanoperedens thermophilum TaxID=2766897 RepID=A0A848DAS6_9EURY|nr:type II toxin-antitoxin system RelE/ParE family toxin [Candidatus Ethanoperedens thermophilum]